MSAAAVAAAAAALLLLLRGERGGWGEVPAARESHQSHARGPTSLARPPPTHPTHPSHPPDFLLYTTTPRVAAAVSRGDKAEVAAVASQGLWLGAAIGTAMSAAQEAS